MGKGLKYPDRMRFHDVSDTPRYDFSVSPRPEIEPTGDRISHVFFGAPGGFKRPAQITRKKDGALELVCWKCQKCSIPMPSGATKDTAYICPTCSPLGSVEGAEFDRCAFDNAGAGKRLSKSDILAKMETECDRIVMRISPAIHAARQAGELWALKATPENIKKLPERYRMSLLLTYWGGLLHSQVAEMLGKKELSVMTYVRDAKKLLLSM